MNNLKDLLLKKRKALTNKTKIDVCIEIAILHYENNDIQKAIDEYKEVLELADECDDILKKCKAYRYIGECLLDLQKPMEALEYVKEYLKVAQESKEVFEIQRAYVTIGRCFLDYSGIVKNPTAKQTAAIKSENAFIKSLQLCQQISENEENRINNYKSKTELTNELAEMRAVSLFNLGLVNREKSDGKSTKTAERYFIQCGNVSLKQKLNEMFFQSSFQQFDLNYCQSLEQFSITNSGKSRLIADEALSVLKKNLNQLAGVTLTSTMKKISKEIQELEAQSLVIANRCHKAAKKYKNLMRRSHNNRGNYKIKMHCAIKLDEKLQKFNPNSAKTEETVLIGQIYDELGIQLVAGKYYEVALQKLGTCRSELYYKLLNRLININQSIGHYKENIKLLESKLKWKIDRNCPSVCCKIIEQLLDCYLRSGSAPNQIERLILIAQQLDSFAILTGQSSIKISAIKSIINLYEELGTASLKLELEKEKTKLRHLEANSEIDDNENDEELNEEEDVDLSDLEISENENLETLSSDSDIDLRSLTESQIEELEAVGKRVKPGKNNSFIKKNEKGESLLHVAAINGNLKQVEKLVDKMDHPIDIVDSAGWTPLHDAANHGRTKIVEFLIDRGANIEHTGPSIDCSTPLMEAVHGGNIGTATLLIERGANLWHKNRQGENLGDCVSDWCQRCKDNNSYGELEAREYKHIMSLIRKKLGDKYIEWCRQRRGDIKSKAISVSVKFQKKDKPKSYVDNRRTIAQEDSDTDNSKIQLDEENPIMDYLTAINSLRNSSKSGTVSQPSDTQNVTEEAGYVIGDDWIENDMPSTTKKFAKEPDYGGYIRKSRKRISESHYDEEIVKPSRKKMNVKLIQSPPREPAIQTIDDIDSSQISHGHSSQTDDLFDDSVSTILSSPSLNIPRVTNKTTVTVVYRSLSMLVPISTEYTVEYLIKETIRRYSLLNPSDKIIPCQENIRISTEDGSLMLPSDYLIDIINGLGNGPMKFLATDIKILF